MKASSALRRWAVCVLAAVAAVTQPGRAGAIGIEDVVDGGNTYAWQRVELPGTVCSDGSQYRFWYYDSPTSNNLLISLEGGGACWDYPSCSGQAGIQGAAHPNGIPTDYITQFEPQYVSPIVNGADPGIPLRAKKDIATKDWDVVYMPYCTGDVHVGNRVVTYTDPTGVKPADRLPAQRLQQHGGGAQLPARAVPEHQQAPDHGLQRRGRGEQRGVLPGAADAGAGEGISPERFGADLPGPERDVQFAAAARPDHGAVEPGVALQPAAGVVQSERLREHERDGGDAVSDGPALVRGLQQRLQLLALLVRAVLSGDHAGGGAGEVAAGRDEPDQPDQGVRELQLPRTVAPADQRQPLRVDHHLHRQPRVSDGAEEEGARGADSAVDAVLDLSERQHRSRRSSRGSSRTTSRRGPSSRRTTTTTRIRGCRSSPR
jgi:hypothetical protein